jgi:hypothetical protein
MNPRESFRAHLAYAAAPLAARLALASGGRDARMPHAASRCSGIGPT